MSASREVRPASTVVLLRDAGEGIETLLLQRNKALVFAGGAWVFPGGAVDAEDLDAAGGDSLLASRIAAAREAEEESGLLPRLDDMVLLSHWTTPEGEPRRYSTWIYAAALAADDEVCIDGGEIHDSQWIKVREAVAEHEAGELGMLPPTYVTLCNLVRYSSVQEMLAAERDSPVPEVFPIFGNDGEQLMVMFRGDAGYDSGDAGAAGARHRAVLREGTWEYQYHGVSPEFAPLIHRSRA